MQQSYFTKYAVIGLSTIALSLSGMEIEQKNPDYTVTVVPSHYYHNIIKPIRPIFRIYFAAHCMELGETTKIIEIATLTKIKNNKTNVLMDEDFPKEKTLKDVGALPQFVPIETFTQGKKYIVATKNFKFVELVSGFNYSEDFFKPYDSELHDPQDITTRIQKAQNATQFLQDFNTRLFEVDFSKMFEENK